MSEDFVYFGGEGPKLPARFRHGGLFDVICLYRNYRRLTQPAVISAFERWIRSLDVGGFQGKPFGLDKETHTIETQRVFQVVNIDVAS